MSAAATTETVAVLRRWEESGAMWRVLSATAGQVTVSLCTCDGGEEVSRIFAPADELAGFLAGRASSLDDAS